MLRDKIQEKTDERDIASILQNSYLDPSEEISRPPVLLSIREPHGTQTVDKRILTLGNFSCVIGKAKTKKTFLVSMMTAAILRGELYNLNGYLPKDRRRVLYFDTEQGRWDHYNVLKRIERLVGTDNIAEFYSYHLRPFDPLTRCELIEKAFELYGADCSYCVIDGIADLALGINDEEEATRVSTLLMKITDDYNCHLTTVLHQNKGDNFATGHLGSYVMKKAEMIMSATKCEDDRDLTLINCDFGRGVEFEPFGMRVDFDGLPYICEFEKRKKSAKRSFDNEPNQEDAPF